MTDLEKYKNEESFLEVCWEFAYGKNWVFAVSSIAEGNDRVKRAIESAVYALCDLPFYKEYFCEHDLSNAAKMTLLLACSSKHEIMINELNDAINNFVKDTDKRWGKEIYVFLKNLKDEKNFKWDYYRDDSLGEAVKATLIVGVASEILKK
jgi:hypothetical protein